MASKKTIHGWDIIEDGNDDRLRNLKVPGTTRSLKVRKDIGPYLIAFASEYHTQIAAIDKGTYDDWAWCPPRDGRASSQTSDHCGGVAIDLNATKEGSQSKSNVFWATKPNKALAMRRLLKKYDLLEWGGDYKRFFDPMHVTFKYGVKAADVKAAMKRMAIDSNGVIK